MGPAFVAVAWVIVVGAAFLPVFIVALFMMHSVGRAFVLSAAFTAGALAGFVGCGVASGWLLQTRTMEFGSTALLIGFATAGAIGGGILAVYILGRFSKYPPWRRY
jgi:hypothetical protein